MTTFHSFALSSTLARRVDELGFQVPTDIQRSAIPALVSGRDVVGIAQTGTGKTAAFGLPLLMHVDPQAPYVQGLVLVPTRELAIQVAEAIDSFAAHHDAEVIAVYGGSSYLPQLRALKRGAQIVVGTPGRVMDLMDRGALKLDRLEVLILDEADEMLTMGFAEDVDQIASKARKERITGLFSATMPKAIERIAGSHLREPLRIEVTPAASTAQSICQEYAVVPHRFKTEALERVLATTEGATIVFVRTRAATDEVLGELARKEVNVAAISGDVQQSEREKIVRRLREGTLDVLVATDVAARGLDVERIGLVVNLDPPREPEAYVHRIGRTGRAGRAGRALTFFTPREEKLLRAIERATSNELTEVSVPTPDEVRNFQIQRALRALPTGDLAPFRAAVAQMNADPLDVAAALLARAVRGSGPLESGPGTLPAGKVRYEERVDGSGAFLKAVFEHGRGGQREARPGRDREASYPHRFRIEVGHRDRVQPGRIVAALTKDSGISGRDIGRIQIMSSFALVDLARNPSEAELRRISRAKIGGRNLRISPDSGGQRRTPSKDSRKRR